MPDLSVIIPTYNETENIRPLCERLFRSCKAEGINCELIVVDDESPGTEETRKIVQKLAKEKYDIKIHSRKSSEGRGLSSAVLLGFEIAKHETVLCMDADLQHEPESVPRLADPVFRGKGEFSIGSRYCGQGGGFGFEWAYHRRIISFGATLLAAGISTSSDPMSGFFCLTKSVLQRGKSRLNPIGFKIGLEIMVKCRASPVVDVPITFQSRVAGESKLTMKQNILYLQQLLGLYTDMYLSLDTHECLLLISLVVFLAAWYYRDILIQKFL